MYVFLNSYCIQCVI
uniref:Uncharacterized protein n=1 Tax=Lepeophtheirus salmonis TaxID=72036 RepID=A0A0K2T324_LEPSM